MKRKLSQKLVVKHDGETLLDKVFFFSKPYEGYCFVAWVSQGVNFGIYYKTVRVHFRVCAVSRPGTGWVVLYRTEM